MINKEKSIKEKIIDALEDKPKLSALVGGLFSL